MRFAFDMALDLTFHHTYNVVISIVSAVVYCSKMFRMTSLTTLITKATLPCPAPISSSNLETSRPHLYPNLSAWKHHVEPDLFHLLLFVILLGQRFKWEILHAGKLLKSIRYHHSDNFTRAWTASRFRNHTFASSYYERTTGREHRWITKNRGCHGCGQGIRGTYGG